MIVLFKTLFAYYVYSQNVVDSYNNCNIGKGSSDYGSVIMFQNEKKLQKTNCLMLCTLKNIEGWEKLGEKKITIIMI